MSALNLAVTEPDAHIAAADAAPELVSFFFQSACRFFTFFFTFVVDEFQSIV